jgi:ATP-dependent helicase YprA (DUF1998 family)
MTSRDAPPAAPQHPSTPTTSTPATPRKHKKPASQKLQGIKTRLPPHLSIANIKSCLRKLLKLSFDPDDFQAHTIRRALQGYDIIFVAGTGYGKSLIYKGIAALAGTGKLVVVIGPLKALEVDQVSGQVCTALFDYLHASAGKSGMQERSNRHFC